MSLKRALFFVIAVLVVNGCAGLGKTPSESSNDESNPKMADFEMGLKALENEHYREAASIFDRLLVQTPASEFDLVVLFNSGAALEGMGECNKASERYRQVVRSSSKKFERIEAQAFFRLAMAYECQGQDAKAVAALLDARKRARELPEETQVAEIPARLSAMYARMGQRQKALEYFNQASRGLKTLISKGAIQQNRELLARTLYYMGQLNHGQRVAKADPLTYLQSIGMQQAYLLQAIEMNHKLWSTKAEEDLRTAYQNIWSFSFTNPEDRRQVFTRSLQTYYELKRLRLPKADSRVDGLFQALDGTEKKLHAELAKTSVTNPLTPEAEDRQSLKQQGRLVDPEAPQTKSKKKK